MTGLQAVFFYSMIATFACILFGYTVRLLQLLSVANSLRKYEKGERYADHGRFTKSENTIPVSILVPVYNESDRILDTARNLLSLNFPEYEVIIINDGSIDNTLLLLKLEFELVALQQPYKRTLKTGEIINIYRSPLFSNLTVIDKPHGGKADALNMGLNVSNYPVVLTLRADCILEKDALIKMIMPFVNDFRVVGLSGMVRVASGWRLKNGQPESMILSRNPLICLQTIEYLRTFLTGRVGDDALGMVQILSGSFGAYNKGALFDIGGFTSECISEDLDVIVRLHRNLMEKGKPYAVKFLVTPVCWTRSPDSYGELLLQRRDWHRKLIDSLKKNKDMLFKKAYGKLGSISLPYCWLFEYFGPVLQVIAHVLLLLSWVAGAVGFLFALSIFMLVALYGTILSTGVLLLEERSIEKYDTAFEMIRLVAYSFLDNVWFRQLNALVCVLTMFGKKIKNEESAHV